MSVTNRLAAVPALTDRASKPGDSPVASLEDTDRNASLDMLRLAAAFIIVLFHAKAPGGQMMPAAMAIFAALLGYFALAGRGERSFAALVRKRSDRLLRPFLIWGAFYATLRVADARAAHEPVLDTLLAWLPPQGTLGALWFLPFAFLVSLALGAARHALPVIAAPMVALPLAAIVSALWLPMLSALQPDAALAVYLDYVPAVFFGAALAAASGARTSLLLTGATALALGFGLRQEGIGGTMTLTLGIPLLTLTLLLPRPGTRLTRMMADLSMAVYLIHLSVLAVGLRLLPVPAGSLALGLVVCGVSTGLGLVLLRSRLGRRLI